MFGQRKAYRTESGPSRASENSDSVGLANEAVCEVPTAGVLWFDRPAEYWPDDEVIWLEPIPIDEGYGTLEASIAMLCDPQASHFSHLRF